MSQAHETPPPSRRLWLRTGYRLIFIGVAMVLLAVTAIVVGTSWLAGQSPAEIETDPVELPARPQRQHVEAGSLYYLDLLSRYTALEDVQATQRSLEVYYSRRTFDGAPPWIPHPVEDAMAVGGSACLQCHEIGGYVPTMQAYAPVAPHPELVSCTQCHVPALTEEVFRDNQYTPPPPPELPGGAYPGAPPPVPHAITPQMRENCAACHIGPAAPPEIRTDHLERSYCLQCHVPIRTDTAWSREEVVP